MHKLGVLASGEGTNLQAIINSCANGTIPDTQVAIVISDNPYAHALLRAGIAKIKREHFIRQKFSGKEEFFAAIIEALDSANVDLVCLAGFMRILPKSFVQKFKGRCINIHPSLLPSFPGLDGQKQAWDYGVKVSGCTVHYVDEGCDTGPVILQRVVTVDEGCTADELAAKILQEEHIAYPEAIRLHLSGKLRVDGRRVTIL